MIRQKSLKLLLFVVPAILLMAALCVYAAHNSGYYSDKNINPGFYWSAGINNVGFTGRTAHSDHRYALENYSKYDLEVGWEYAHKVMLPDGSLFRNISKHGLVTVKANRDKYAASTRSTGLPKGSFYIDAYTSVNVRYKKKRARISQQIKFAKASEVSSVELLQ